MDLLLANTVGVFFGGVVAADPLVLRSNLLALHSGITGTIGSVQDYMENWGIEPKSVAVASVMRTTQTFYLLCLCKN